MWCKKVVRELENDQHVSLEANVFRFPFIFFNLFGNKNKIDEDAMLCNTLVVRHTQAHHKTFLAFSRTSKRRN